MFNIQRVIKHNNETFYDYSTGEHHSQKLVFALKAILALSLAALFCNLSKDFLNAVITIFSILIGFSFNVLFYLLSNPQQKNESIDDSIESKLRIKKIGKISNELFYNVSYFNIVSIIVVLIALIYFVFDSRITELSNRIFEMNTFTKSAQEYEQYLHCLRVLLTFLYRFALYFFLVESLCSFIRTSGRVSFFFQEKIAVQNRDDSKFS